MVKLDYTQLGRLDLTIEYSEKFQPGNGLCLVKPRQSLNYM